MQWQSLLRGTRGRYVIDSSRNEAFWRTVTLDLDRKFVLNTNAGSLALAQARRAHVHFS